jgi:hypothetical protein
MKSFKIPKRNQSEPWTVEQVENFKKNWPYLRNFDYSVLKFATLKELTGMAKQKVSGLKLLSQAMAATFDQLQSFPAQVEAGPDDCLGLVHVARFLRGYVGDPQELWVQARKFLGSEGLDPITNYEVVSVGLGELLTPEVWSEIHKPSSRNLSIRLLSTKSVELAWKTKDQKDSPKEFESLLEFKMAAATLDAVIQRVMPWNMAFKTVYLFLVSNDFGEIELANSKNKLLFLANFVDEVLRANARFWEEAKKFMGHQDMCVKWNASLARRVEGGNPATNPSGKKGEKGKDQGKKELKVPGWICKKFNDGTCDSKDAMHAAYWNPAHILKHQCSKMLKDQKKFCLQTHPEHEHK